MYLILIICLLRVVGDLSQGRPEGSLFNSYYTEVSGRALLLSLDCSTLPSIHTLYCWVLSKEVSSIIFKVFGMMWPGIESRSLRSLANTLPTGPMSRECSSFKYCYLMLIILFNITHSFVDSKMVPSIAM